MKNKDLIKSLIILLIAFSVCTMASAQDDLNSGIIYGGNHAFGLTAPDGWVLDNEAGVSQGLYAVFYKKGETWKSGVTVMYANTSSLENEAHPTLEKLIEFDSDGFKKDYPDIEISDGSDIIINDKDTAIIKYMSGKSYGNFEAVAYIDAGKTAVMIVMTSRTKEGFENSLKAFESLVKSYIFITDKVDINEE